VLALDAGNTKSYPNTGTVWTDLSGNGNTVTLVNGPTFNSYEARTNGNLYSNAVTNAYYTAYFVTTGASSETAPDGTTTASYFTLSATATTYKGVTGGFITYPTSSIVTISCFVKPTGGARYFWIREGSYGSSRVGFDLTSVSVFSSSSATGYINAAGNGWYRVQAVMGALPQSSARVQLLGASDTTPPGNANVTSVGTETYHIWGAQCELGSFATSPMLTTSSAVTRNAGPATLVFDGVNDYGNVTITSTTVFCAEIWVFFNGNIGQDADMSSITGYQCASFSYQPSGGYSGGYDGFTLGNWTGTATNETIGYFHNGGNFRYIIDPILAGWHQVGINWNSSSGSYDIYVDGTVRTTYSGSFYPNISQFSTTRVTLGSSTGGSGGQYFFNGKIAAAKLWNSSLTADQVLQNFNALRGRFGL
jgi:hypothetical protein